jgi:hypothetical protein
MFRPMISMAMKPEISEANAEPAEVDRPDLRVAELAHPVGVARHVRARF